MTHKRLDPDRSRYSEDVLSTALPAVFYREIPSTEPPTLQVPPHGFWYSMTGALLQWRPRPSMSEPYLRPASPMPVAAAVEKVRCARQEALNTTHLWYPQGLVCHWRNVPSDVAGVYLAIFAVDYRGWPWRDMTDDPYTSVPNLDVHTLGPPPWWPADEPYEPDMAVGLPAVQTPATSKPRKRKLPEFLVV